MVLGCNHGANPQADSALSPEDAFKAAVGTLKQAATCDAKYKKAEGGGKGYMLSELTALYEVARAALSDAVAPERVGGALKPTVQKALESKLSSVEKRLAALVKKGDGPGSEV